MKTKNKLILNFGKILLVICTLFSQLSFSLEVFADEVVSSSDNGEAVDNLKNSSDYVSLGNDINVGDKVNMVDDSNSDATDGDLGDENLDSKDNDNNVEDNRESNELVYPEVIFEGNNVVVLGSLKGELSVASLRELLVKQFGEEYSEVEISVSDDSLVTNESPIMLIVDEVQYTVVVKYDMNNDGIVDENDVNLLTESILNEDSLYDINDLAFVSSSVKNGVWCAKVDNVDVLDGNLFSNDVLVGENVEVKLYLKDFNKNLINGISGLIEYDEALLKLDSIKISDGYSNAGSIKDGKFIYLLNDYNNSDDVLVTFVFSSLGKTDDFGTEISITNLVATYNGVSVALKNDELVTYVVVTPSGMGGGNSDTDEETNTESNGGVSSNDSVVGDNKETINDTSSDNSSSSTLLVNPVTVTTTNQTYVTLSNNNYISDLDIEGYDLKFDMYTYEYSLSVDNDIDSLNISVVLDNERASYVINGNENFKEGSNKVEIVVTAEDGTERIYSIDVDKDDNTKKTTKDKKSDDSEEEDEESNTSKTVIIILIVLVIIGLIYVIFKDDEEDEEIVVKSTKNDIVKKKSNTTKKK